VLAIGGPPGFRLPSKGITPLVQRLASCSRAAPLRSPYLLALAWGFAADWRGVAAQRSAADARQTVNLEVHLRPYLSMSAVLFSLLLPLQAPAAPAAREQIPEALSAKVRAKKLVARDQPLAVGAVAPRFAALSRVPTAIVFYRGHW
jgi:hypothetical protein